MTAVADLTVQFDAEGFMTDPNEWTPEIAAVLAQEEGIDALTDEHWTVINFVRDEFAQTGQSPTLRAISKRSGVDTKTLYALFPKGPAKKVARIAGLGKPKGCI
ncbi:MAG: TusE/DsrC/DsvC family sulfur relay protein [Caldilineaceae bacterium]|nr:TusE/DsrC/DsvC family sulfur relay protein [Caldilineaceae bacterium]MCB9162595.1 TusE/DsrC/DsvC family sulfur relay protein [Caldilineaceae bacterium]